MRYIRFYILLTFIGCSHISLAQYARYTYHDDEKTQLKEIYHVKDTLTNVLEGKYLSYHINGNIESKGQFSNNETVGQWEFYYETGKLKMLGDLENSSSDGFWQYFYENGHKSMEGRIVDKKRTGEWKVYFESGELKEQGHFIDNLREDNWTFYYEDGSIKGEINYTKGVGRLTEYYPSGEIKAEGPMTDTKKEGEWNYYYKDGGLQATGQYQDGEKVGGWKFYHHNGQVSAEGNYSDGEPNGSWTYYHENGIISTKGEFVDGKKNGYWGLFYGDGTLKGESNFNMGEGTYVEYYPSGKLKLKGFIKDGKNDGEWKYFYETGELEGECDFEEGRGIYHGYYPDQTLQTKGPIEDGRKVGRWDLYKNDGSLSGYFKPIYDNNLLKEDDFKKLHQTKKYGVAEFRFKGKKFKYFEPKINEFQGLIGGINPFASFLGRVSAGMEFYMQERLGHELEFEGIRDPFFVQDKDIPLDEVFTRGYSAAIRQKFYNDGGEFGLWYFGHEIRYSNLGHYANLSDESQPDDVIRASADEFKVEYSLLLGYRLMQHTRRSGFTADAFISLGTGYRNFNAEDQYIGVFKELPQSNIPLAYNFGVNIGYTFSFGARGKK